jgi:hypothetical protein
MRNKVSPIAGGPKNLEPEIQYQSFEILSDTQQSELDRAFTILFGIALTLSPKTDSTHT